MKEPRYQCKRKRILYGLRILNDLDVLRNSWSDKCDIFFESLKIKIAKMKAQVSKTATTHWHPTNVKGPKKLTQEHLVTGHWPYFFTLLIKAVISVLLEPNTFCITVVLFCYFLQASFLWRQKNNTIKYIWEKFCHKCCSCGNAECEQTDGNDKSCNRTITG